MDSRMDSSPFYNSMCILRVISFTLLHIQLMEVIFLGDEMFTAC